MARPASERRHGRAFVVLLLGALGLARFVGGGAGAGPAAAPPKGAPELAPRAVVAPFAGTVPEGPAAAAAAASAGDDGPRLERERLRTKRLVVLEDLRELTRFPPTSRPLEQGMTDVLEPHRRYDEPQALEALRGDKDTVDEETDLYVSFTGPRYEVLPDEPLVAQLRVTRGHPSRGKRTTVPLDHVEATLEGAGLPAPLPFPLRDDGRGGDDIAGDGVYGGALTPATTAPLREAQGAAVVRARFAVRGDPTPWSRALDVLLNGRPPARFTGAVAETLEGGNLVLAPGLAVEEGGVYLVRGLLFDAHGKPVAHATFRGLLPTGEGRAPLVFAGLLFHEADAVAPFVLRTVTGRRLAQSGEAFDRILGDLPGEHPTATYARSAFSTSEWGGPERQRLLREAQALAEENPPLETHTRATVVVDVAGGAGKGAAPQ